MITVSDRNGAFRLFEYGFTVSPNLAGLPIAARPRTGHDGDYDLYFCHHRLTRISLHDRFARV
jgi:hypothetical protein